MERNCSICGKPIPEGRLKAIPTVKTCVNCSDTDKVYGHNIITGKNTYSELQIVDAETSKRLRALENRVGYGVSNGVKFDADKNKQSNDL